MVARVRIENDLRVMKRILRTTANNSNRYEPMNSTRKGNCCPLVVATLVHSSRTFHGLRSGSQPKLIQVLVAIVVVMSFFVPAFVLAVVLVPATLVPVVVMVPVETSR